MTHQRHNTQKRLRAATVVGAALLLCAIAGCTHQPVTPEHSAKPHAPQYIAPSDAELGRLPVDQYDAVNTELPAFDRTVPSRAHLFSWTLRATAPLYATPGGKPVAVMPQENFLREPRTVLAVDQREGWTQVLTASRGGLPSKVGTAPAQTAAWVPTSLLTHKTRLTETILISVGAQTLTITRGAGPVGTFKIGVGTPNTPTPTGVTGAIQAKYVDPTQGTGEYPIALTTLHSSTADEPYGGSDGGLIGLHYSPSNHGAISHGCIRLSTDAITAVNHLPVGTPVTIQP